MLGGQLRSCAVYPLRFVPKTGKESLKEIIKFLKTKKMKFVIDNVKPAKAPKFGI